MRHKYIQHIAQVALAMALLGGTTSCEDFLNREPMSKLSPETYYTSAAQLEANLNDEYPNILPSYGQWDYGIYGADNDTDNQTDDYIHDRFTTDQWRVPHSEDNNWKFERIYRTNFFLSQVMPKFGTAMDLSLIHI